MTIIVAAICSMLRCFVLVDPLSYKRHGTTWVRFTLLEVVVTVLFAYAAWLDHIFRASIAKIPDHCAAAMFAGMFRPHLRNVVVSSHVALVIVRAHTDANCHEEWAMESVQKTKLRVGNQCFTQNQCGRCNA